MVLETRTGTTLNEAQLQKVRDHGNYPLIDRLRQMDREATFPRFVELAPELRLGVCEVLLTAEKKTHRHEGMPALHPAVLRTSKQVYSEAMPILYKKNKFRVNIWYSETSSWFHHAGIVPVCTLAINRPGGEFSFYHRTGTSTVPVLRSLLEHSSAMHMLRSLTHLTINFSVVTPGDDESDDYVPKARDAIACLCLSLTGASKMKQPTINVNVDPKRPQRSKVDFARILWPLVFLRTDIVVKFAGITEIQKTSAAGWPRNSHAEAPYGRHIAKTRHLCMQEIENHGTNVVGLRGVEAAVASMNFFGDEFVSMDDIVNLSAAWTGMRSEADRVEAAGLERWDPL